MPTTPPRPARVFSLVLPAYNPGDKIDATHTAVVRFVREQVCEWEVLFVLDGCTDGTGERLDRLCESDPDPRVKVLGYPKNRGKGHAVRTGLLAATGRVRAFTDVDLAYDFDDIVKVVSAVSATSPAAVACRNHPDSLLLIPDRMLWYAFRRKVQSLAFRTATRFTLGLRHPDTQAGLKAFSAEVVERIAPELTCDGFGFDCELLLALKRAKVPVTELPVRVKYEEGSTTGTGTGFRMLRELWRIRKRWRKKKLPAFTAAGLVAKAA